MYLIKLFRTQEDKEADNGRTFVVEDEIDPRALAARNNFCDFQVLGPSANLIEVDKPEKEQVPADENLGKRYGQINLGRVDVNLYRSGPGGKR